MKRLASLGAFVVLSAGLAQAGDVDPDLGRILANTPPNEVVSALVYLEDRVDLVAMSAQLDGQHAKLKTRHETVVRSLQEKAAATQGALLEHLDNLQAAGRIVQAEAFWIANVIRVDAPPAEIALIAQRDDVAKVYFNYEIEPIEPVTTGPAAPGGVALVVEPGIQAIRAPEAWALGIDGTGTLVSTLDTGVDGDHPALASRWQGLDPNYIGHPEWAWFDPVTNTTFPQGFGNHGSHTMGTVCGGAPGDQVGVAPGARWIHAAVIDRVSIAQTIADALLSFQWVIDPDGDPATDFDVPDVCSNSWGLADWHGQPDCDELFWVSLDACEAAGIVIVFAAGNEGSGGLRRPADRATDDYRTLAVAAVNGNIAGWPIAGFSSRGPTFCTPDGTAAIKPEISAPGEDVRSCNQTGGYYTSGGTSMAAPHICGVVALMRQANPELPVNELKQIMYDTGFDLGSPGNDNDYGWGMVDAYEAVQQALLTVNLDFTYPDGLPNIIDSDGGTTVRVLVSGSATTPLPNTGKLYYSTGAGYTEVPMQETSPNEYEGVFPSFDCPETVTYYFSAEAESGNTSYDPESAPDETYTATAWADTDFAFQDAFEADLGWLEHSAPGITGAWERGVPAGGGDLGDPAQDADGSGQCYVTGLADGDNDVDGGSTSIYSPIMDASDPDAILGYWRWYSTTTDGNPSDDILSINVSDNGGLSWTSLETVGPGGPETDGGWIRKEFLVADLPGIVNSNQLRIHVQASDYSPDSTVEAGVDGVEVFTLVCAGPGCPADIDGNGSVDVNDFLILLGAWGPNPGHPADIDGNDAVDVNDFLALLADWGPCP
ncbi:MAG: S8 family serine peptidase [Planctomycetota bacterium]|jgi:subtilisin family serine protease